MTVRRGGQPDTYNPVEPAAFLTRLRTLGFGQITLGVDHVLTFVAHRPDAQQDGGLRAGS